MNRGLILAGAVVIAANAFALAHVAYNRSRVIQRIELSEFELPVQYTDEDNSGTSLRWATITRGTFSPEDEWPSASDLQQSGFSVRSGGEQLPREIFVALELDGEVWRSWYDRHTLEQRRKYPNTVFDIPRTRLIPVDIARDAETLFRRYPDRTRYIIMRAAVRPYNTGALWGARADLLPDSIYVPLPFSGNMRLLARPTQPQANARYSVTLCFGRNYEPWIESVAMNRH